MLNYQCTLSALSSDPKAGSGWQPLGEKTGIATLQVSPTPFPIKDRFTWYRARAIDNRSDMSWPGTIVAEYL